MVHSFFKQYLKRCRKVISRLFGDLEILLKYAEFYITSGYTMFVTPVFN